MQSSLWTLEGCKNAAVACSGLDQECQPFSALVISLQYWNLFPQLVSVFFVFMWNEASDVSSCTSWSSGFRTASLRHRKHHCSTSQQEILPVHVFSAGHSRRDLSDARESFSVDKKGPGHKLKSSSLGDPGSHLNPNNPNFMATVIYLSRYLKIEIEFALPSHVQILVQQKSPWKISKTIFVCLSFWM